MGARIMMLFDGHCAALFTAEGRPTRSASTVTHGPLSMRREGKSIVLAFRGPAVIVPDATAYLSIERALASGRLDGDTEVEMRFEIEHSRGEFDFDRILSSSGTGADALSSSVAFGRVSGKVRIDRAAREVNGFARAGMSFTGLGPQKFTVRRMLWACFENEDAPRALEARSVATPDAPPNQSARILGAGGWSQCELRDLTIETAVGRGAAAPYFCVFEARRRVVMRDRRRRRMLHTAVAARARQFTHLHVTRIRELQQRSSSRSRDV